MKKILIILFLVIILSGCTKLSNTPTSKVDELFNNYQTLDEDVIKQLDDIVSSESNFNQAQKERYKDIIKKQYKDLTYEIKDEEINGNKSIVTTQVNVKDYRKVLDECDIYFEEHKDEFKDSNGNYESKYIDYRLDKLDDAKDKVSYTLEINLTKQDNKWELDGLSSDDMDKITGVYDY